MSLRDGKSYASRNFYLRMLGFCSYAAYLKSDLWKKVRKRVFECKGRDCYLCGKYATQVHHNRYHKNDLTGKRLKFLNPICGECHDGIEFLAGKKASLEQAKRKFDRIRRRKNKMLKDIKDLLLRHGANEMMGVLG